MTIQDNKYILFRRRRFRNDTEVINNRSSRRRVGVSV